MAHAFCACKIDRRSDVELMSSTPGVDAGRTEAISCAQRFWSSTRASLIAPNATIHHRMALTVDIPGRDPLSLEHLLLDQNGTLTDRGVLIDGVSETLVRVKKCLEPHLLSADTFGTLDQLADQLDIDARRVNSGAEKLTFLEALGRGRCVAIGNGANDEPMLQAAALGIAVIGPEGAAASALRAADVICRSIVEALDLLLDARLLVATLRI